MAQYHVMASEGAAEMQKYKQKTITHVQGKKLLSKKDVQSCK
jgi:hypothetical protein